MMRAEPFLLEDDGDTPNHPRWPLILYRGATAGPDDGEAFDALFEANGWPVSWHNGIYPFTHFHSLTHEALGIARGAARVQFGGEAGPIVAVRAGDAALLPAGTGHKLISADRDLLVVGAYPPGASYDLLRAGEKNGEAIRARIAAVPRPARDPVSGRPDPLHALWRIRSGHE